MKFFTHTHTGIDTYTLQQIHIVCFSHYKCTHTQVHTHTHTTIAFSIHSLFHSTSACAHTHARMHARTHARTHACLHAPKLAHTIILQVHLPGILQLSHTHTHTCSHTSTLHTHIYIHTDQISLRAWALKRLTIGQCIFLPHCYVVAKVYKVLYM